MTEQAEVPSRAAAWALLTEHVQSESLRQHALAVEAAMRHQARKQGEDEEAWGVVGLVHDLDYEKHPEQHCMKTKEWLEAAGWPTDLVRAVLSHGWGICTDVEPQTPMEKALYAVDELTGLVSATARVRPGGLQETQVKSVKKKWKQKSFAAGVDRDVIQKGADRMGIPLDDLIQDVIEAMRSRSGFSETRRSLGEGGPA